MKQYETQSGLFAERPSRLWLLGQATVENDLHRYKVNVWRNHALEPLLPLMQPYCEFGGWTADWVLHDYDDSLSFSGHDQADLELIWLDSSRFKVSSDDAGWLEWLANRVQAVRALSSKPIVLASWPTNDGPAAAAFQKLVDSVSGAFWADLALACEQLGVPLLETRTAMLAGTPLASVAQLRLAQKLACHWLPATLLPGIKAVAVDLDNTLYHGVLGEDGPTGVQLTLAHKALHDDLKQLRERGIFLALVSRNERQDVEELFASRSDFGLAWDDFSVHEISWGEKADALARVANALRIAPDAILFVDDNLGELLNVSNRLPQIKTGFAHEDAEQTRRMLHFYPGLWRWREEQDNTKRILDLKANAQRAAIAAQAIDPESYLRSLQVSLIYRYDPLDQLGRLTDLCNKTNQFNLAMRRMNHAEVATYANELDCSIVSVQLTDRLSESGVIAMMAVRRKDDMLVVEELCISCRALGRNLEDAIVFEPLRKMPLFRGCQKIAFDVSHGPRNQPALNWFKRAFQLQDVPEEGRYIADVAVVSDYRSLAGMNILEAKET